MTPEGAYVFIRENGDTCARVLNSDGGKLVEFDTDNVEKLIGKFEHFFPNFQSLGKIRVYTSTAISSCTNDRGHHFIIDFPKDGTTQTAGAAPSPTVQNGVGFETVLKYLSEKDTKIMELQTKIAEQSMQRMEDRIAGIEKEKKNSGNWWEHFDKISDGIVKLAPTVMSFKNGTTPPISGGIRGPQAKTRLVFEDMAKQGEAEQNSELNKLFAQIQGKITRVDLMAVYNMILLDPQKVMTLVYALNEKPEYVDMAVNFLAPKT